MYWLGSSKAAAESELFIRGKLGFSDLSDEVLSKNAGVYAASSIRAVEFAGNSEAEYLLDTNPHFAFVASNDPDFLADQFKRSKRKGDKSLIVSNRFTSDDIRSDFFEENVWALSGDTLVQSLRYAPVTSSVGWLIDLLTTYGHTPALTKTIQIADASMLAAAAMQHSPSVFTMCYQSGVISSLGADNVFSFLKDYPILISRVCCDADFGITSLSSDQLLLLAEWASEYKVVDDGFSRVSKRLGYSSSFSHHSVNPIQHASVVSELAESPTRGVAAAGKKLVGMADRDMFDPKSPREIVSLMADAQLFNLIK